MLKLPTLVGYLAAGLVLAGFGFKASPLLTQIGDLGVIFLLFTVGLHIRLKNLLRSEVLGVGGLHLVISIILFGGVGLAMGLSPGAALLIGVGLSFSSTVLTAKSLEARNELDAYHGRIAIGILILQDLVAVALLAFTGTETPQLWSILLLLLPLFRPLLVKLLEASGREELMLLFGLLVALGIGELFALVGLSSKLGALAAGMILAGHPLADELYDQLWGLKEVFLVGFFLQVGLAGLPTWEGWRLVGILLVLLPLKGIIFFALLIAFRLRARTAFMSSITLTAYSEFALIVGVGLAKAGLVPSDVITALALLVAASFLGNAPLSLAANRLWASYEGHLRRFERATLHPDEQPHFLGGATYIVVGMGQAGSAAYDYLRENAARPLGLDVDPAQISQQLQAGRRVIFGDAQDPELWLDLDFEGLQGVILTVPDSQAKLQTTHTLRALGFQGPITALIRQSTAEADLIQAGVTAVCMPLPQAGRTLAARSLQQGDNFSS